MLRYTLLVALLLQCLPLNISENLRDRIDIRNRYSPGYVQFHSPHQHLVSPINLLNPDKYEYFTINNQGNIIKRLMTSKEIQSIVAGSNVRQNMFDKHDSPHGIITNIVSSIKNVLNTELLSKNHENKHPNNNVNENIAEVTSSESSEKENEYVPAILNLVEVSSEHENQENLSVSKLSATKCPDNCEVENDTNIKTTTLVSNQAESTEMYFEKDTEGTPHQTDEIKIENMLQWLMLNTNLPETTEKVVESTPQQLDETTTENKLLSSLFSNLIEFTEKATESTPHQTNEITTENKFMLFISDRLPEFTEKTTKSTPYQVDERITMSTVPSTLAGEEYSYDITTPSSETSTQTPAITLIISPSSETSTQTPLPTQTPLLSSSSTEISMQTPATTLISSPSIETSTQVPATTLIEMSTQNPSTTLISSPSSETSTQNPSTMLISTPSSETSTQNPSTMLISSPSSETSTQNPSTMLISTPSSETSTQIPATTLISTVDDEPEQYSTVIDLQKKLVTQQTDKFDEITVLESTTEITTEEYNLKNENIMITNDNYPSNTDSIAYTDVYSTLAETTHEQESTTLTVPQTTNSKIHQQLLEEPTTLTIDTQNAFYMIMELLKNDNRNEETSIYEHEQENVITDSQEMAEGEEYDEEEYSTIPLELTTMQVTTDTPIYADQYTISDSLYTNLPDSFDTSTSVEQSSFTTMDDIKNYTTPLTTTLKSTTVVMSTSLNITTSTRRMPTARPTNQLEKVPSKPTMTDLHKPSSNEFVSIAEMILRQANIVPQATNIDNANVDNLFDLLSVTNKNMVNYVDETATVASILSHAPLTKTQPINAETSEHDVFQSFLSITNDLKQGILTASTEDAANRITNDLFQKLGESEARRNTSSSDQLSSTDILLDSDNEEEYLEESNENDQDETRELNNFFKLCNKIGMDMYKSMRSIAELQQSKSLAFSPFSAISLLSMLYLGARGKTADKINKLIGLDEMTSFNPHLTFKTISQAIEDENTNSYFVRMLFSDENRGKLQNFFKTKVTQLYSGYAEEISFNDRNTITDRVNILVNNSTQGAQPKFLKEFEIQAAPPLCLISANSFELKCPTKDDDSEIFFHIIDAQGKRKLIELAAAAYSGSFLFGYNTEMDVTVTSIFSETRDISTILLMPGQQGGIIEKNSLLNLENNIFSHNFPSKIKLLETKLKPHLSNILLIPHLNQQSFVNISEQFHQLGLGELFNSESSNLRGIQETTAAPIHLSEVLLINRVSLCNTDREQKLSDRYPSLLDMKSNLNKYIEKTKSTKDHDAMLINENVLKLDKPFLYIIRHNPSQLILYVGRFNPVE